MISFHNNKRKHIRMEESTKSIYFEELPAKYVDEILSYLSVDDLKLLSRTNKFFYEKTCAPICDQTNLVINNNIRDYQMELLKKSQRPYRNLYIPGSFYVNPLQTKVIKALKEDCGIIIKSCNDYCWPTQEGGLAYLLERIQMSPSLEHVDLTYSENEGFRGNRKDKLDSLKNTNCLGKNISELLTTLVVNFYNCGDFWHFMETFRNLTSIKLSNIKSFPETRESGTKCEVFSKIPRPWRLCSLEISNCKFILSPSILKLFSNLKNLIFDGSLDLEFMNHLMDSSKDTLQELSLPRCTHKISELKIPSRVRVLQLRSQVPDIWDFFNLESLTLYNVLVTDNFLENIGKNTCRLRSLNLIGCQFTENISLSERTQVLFSKILSSKMLDCANISILESLNDVENLTLEIEVPLKKTKIGLPNLRQVKLFGEQSLWFAENVDAEELRVFEHVCGDRNTCLQLETFCLMSEKFKNLEEIIIGNSQHWTIPDDIIEFCFGHFENLKTFYNTSDDVDCIDEYLYD